MESWMEALWESVTEDGEMLLLPPNQAQVCWGQAVRTTPCH